MAILQQEQFQEVAALLNSGINEAFKGADASGLQFSVDLNTFVVEGTGSKGNRRFLDQYEFVKNTLGYDQRVFEQLGVNAVFDLTGLTYLVQVGAITPEQAEAFLLTKYPSAGFTGGSFGDVRPLVVPEDDGKAEPAGSPEDEKGVVERGQEAREIQQDIGGGSLVAADASPGSIPIRVGEVPTTIPDSDELQRVLEDTTRQVQRAVSRVQNGQLRLQANSIDGRVIIPGSLPYSAMDPIDAQTRLQEFPGPEQAITLRIVPDPVLDDWAEDEDDLQTSSGLRFKGPRRVWRVASVSAGPEYRPTLGPVRYRIITNEMRFGIGSVRYKDPGKVVGLDSHEIRYGIVIRGIPSYFGRPVNRILYCDYESFSPSALKWQDPGVTTPNLTGPTTLFEETAENKFNVAPPTLYSAFSDATVGGDGGEIPDQEYLDNIDGFTFMLINGRTAEEVYAQLNSLPSTINAHIGGRGAGPGDSCPASLEVTSITTGGVVVAGAGAPTVPVSRTLKVFDPPAGGGPSTAFSLSGAAAPVVQEGVPFLMEDCERLRIKDDTFAVQVQVWPPRVSNWLSSSNGADNYGRHPSHWHLRGVDLDKQNDRRIGIDIVVV